MKVVSWNMGCAPRPSRYRKTHREAWEYLLGVLKPDVAFIQEALRSVSDPADNGVIWSADTGTDSGTAVLIRGGRSAEPVEIGSTGSFLAGANVPMGETSALFISIHVGPPHYRRHLKTLVEQLDALLVGRRFVFGGDLNAARLVDEVQGGRWFTKFFDDLVTRQFHDCHWAQHGKEVQSFWRRETEAPYQCDHMFVDPLTAPAVVSCSVIDNPEVRRLSDHGPLQLELDESLIEAVRLEPDATNNDR